MGPVALESSKRPREAPRQPSLHGPIKGPDPLGSVLDVAATSPLPPDMAEAGITIPYPQRDVHLRQVIDTPATTTET